MVFSEVELGEIEHESKAQLGLIAEEEINEGRLYRVFRTRTRSLPSSEAAIQALKDFRSGNRSAGLIWAKGFAIEFIADIRASLCTKRKGTTVPRITVATARGAATAIASWLMSIFAITNPFAVALATFVVIVIGSAGISAFCTMTDVQVLAAITNAPAN